jgi:shikimate kinase
MLENSLDTQRHIEAIQQTPSLERLVLTGFMGCGKSTIGKRLAQVLGFQFIDTDLAIEQQKNRKIPEIFEKEGEALFRQYESDCLKHALSQSKIVVATGGGALVRQDNLDLALDEAVVIYLELDENELLQRVLFSPKERPLINVKNPAEKVHQLFEARRPFYEQAQVHVATGGLKPEEAVGAVIHGLYKYLRYFLPTLHRS